MLHIFVFVCHLQVKEYHGWLELRNEKSTVFEPFSVLVIYPTQYIRNLSIIAPGTEVNTVAPINITMISGSRLDCTVDYGDTNSDSIASVPYNSVYAKTNTYTTIGHFLITVSCNNTISSAVTSIYISVQERLTGFSMSPAWLFEVDTLMDLNWSYLTGTELMYTAMLATIPLSMGPDTVNFTLDSSWNSVGIYWGWIYANNDVSQPANVTFTVEVARQNQGLSLQCPQYVATGDLFTVTAAITRGSNTDLHLTFPSSAPQSRFISGDFVNITETFTGTNSPVAGVYVIESNCSNALVPGVYPPLTTTCSVVAIDAVGDLNMTAVEGSVLGDPLYVTLTLVDVSSPALDTKVQVTISKTGQDAVTVCVDQAVPVFTVVNTQCPINVSGWYNITAYVSNNVSLETYIRMVPIGDPLTGLWYDLQTPLLGEGQLGSVRVKAQSKYGADVTVNFGDGYISPNNGILPNMWATITHVYPNFGDYSINVTGSTPINTLYEGCQVCVVVQQPLSNIVLAGQTTYYFSTPIMKTWTISSGSHLEYVITFDGLASGISSYTQTPTGGSLSINDISKLTTGYHLISMTGWNNISGPLNTSLTVVVLKPIFGLTVSLASPYVATNATVDLTYMYLSGTMVNVTVSDNLGGVQDQNYHEDSPGISWISPLSFSAVGTYTVNVDATNLLGTVIESGLTVHVLDPVITADLTLTGSTRYQDPIYIEISVNQLQFDPTDYGFTCSFDDGSSQNMAQFTRNNTKTYTDWYSYTNDGKYNVTCDVSNNVSSVSVTKEVSVGTKLGTLVAVISSYLLKTNESLMANATITGGSNLLVEFDFGDGSTGSAPIQTGVEAFMTHRYVNPGDYRVTARVYNGLDEVSIIMPSLVLVQTPIDGAQVAFVRPRIR